MGRSTKPVVSVLPHAFTQIRRFQGKDDPGGIVYDNQGVAHLLLIQKIHTLIRTLKVQISESTSVSVMGLVLYY